MKIKRMFFYVATSHFRNVSLVPSAVDMLRYDLAFICEKYPRLVLFVKLQSTKDGMTSGATCLGRWRSFGWTLDGPYQSHEIPAIGGEAPDPFVHPEEWVTYRHNWDCSDYIKVSLSRYLAAKSTWEVDKAVCEEQRKLSSRT